MKLKTSLQLSAIFPLVFAIVITISLSWWLSSGDRSETYTTIFLAMTGILGLAMTAVIVYYTKDILNKIKILNEWTDTVLKGNLEAAMNLEPSDDEVSRLSYALSKMLREIKEAYSSLHKEADEHKQQSLEHKRLADAAQFGSRQLSDALNRLKESQQEIMQKERLHVYQQVIRGVVHDFGEALTPIQGTIDILLSHPEKLEDKTEALQHLQTISESVQKATKSIKNLAGIYHTHQERSFGPADLNLLIERTLVLLEPRLKANIKGQNIEIKTSFQGVPAVAGEESDIQDAITNLIMNAIEAVPDGGAITLSTYADKSTVTFEIRDTGKGMTEEVKRRCLEPFYTTKTGHGTGMGLTIVNSVIHRHRGVLKIESEFGKGTSIIVRFPIWTETLRERKGLPVSPLSGRKLSILLVDDDPLSLKVIAKSLLSQGHSVVSAASGSEGLEKMKTDKFDVAIVDKAMPGMDGIALTSAIKEIFPKMPVIMLTGYADIMREEGDVPENVDVLLSKPTTMADLDKALDTAASTIKS